MLEQHGSTRSSRLARQSRTCRVESRRAKWNLGTKLLVPKTMKSDRQITTRLHVDAILIILGCRRRGRVPVALAPVACSPVACHVTCQPIIAPAGTRALGIGLPVAGTRYTAYKKYTNTIKSVKNCYTHSQERPSVTKQMSPKFSAEQCANEVNTITTTNCHKLVQYHSRQGKQDNIITNRHLLPEKQPSLIYR